MAFGLGFGTLGRRAAGPARPGPVTAGMTLTGSAALRAGPDAARGGLTPAMLAPAMLAPAILAPAILAPAMLDPAMLDPGMLDPVMLAGEDVLLLSIALPPLPPAQQRAAAAFAVEDRLAQPLEEVRVILGPQYPPGSGHWLVAVVAERLLAATAAAHPGRVLLSDVMRLPVPAQGWMVQGSSGRVLLRLPDGTGMALATPLALDLWRSAGEPAVCGHGPGLPVEFGVTDPLPLPAVSGIPADGFDLGGATAQRLAALPAGWKPLAGLLALALAAHLGLTVLDSRSLARLVATREAALATQLTRPPARGEDILTAAARTLAEATPAAATGFLDLLAKAYSVLPAAGSGVSLSTLRYRATGGQLTLGLVAGDIATLQDVEAALAAAGLRVSTGPAATRSGVAEVEMTVTRPGPGSAP